METTKQYEKGVRGVISRATAFNYEIGGYVYHIITERTIIKAQLTNGTIEMPHNMAQDQENQPQSISDDEIAAVAKTFNKQSK